MSSSLPTRNPTGYLGINPTYPGQIYFRKKAPNNLLDVHNYNPGDTWINTASGAIWMLTRIVNQPPPLPKLANWVTISGAGIAGIATLSGDAGVAVGPVLGNCRITGVAAQGVSTTGIALDNIEITVADATVASKGVARFNNTFFTVAAGLVNPNYATTASAGVAEFDPTYFNVGMGGVVTLTGAGNIVWQPALVNPQALTPYCAYYTTLINTVFNMPAVAPAGSVICIQGSGAGPWIIQLGAGQTIACSATVVTTPGGTVSSPLVCDGIQLLCVIANTRWVATLVKGNLLVT
jgi:hypothetical protein